MESARGPGAEAETPEEEEPEAGETMAAVVSAAGGAGPAVLQVAGLYRGLCAVRSRTLALGFVSPAQLRVFPVRRDSTDSKGVGSELEANPFYDRYRDKIQQLRRSDPAAFESRLEKRIEFQKQPVGHSKQGDFIKSVEQKTDASGKQSLNKGFTKDKTLSSIFNIEMVKDKTGEEIKQIWQQYFAAKDTVYAVIPKEKFDLIWNRAQSCPTFLCALPRREGYEFFVGQWTGTELHFTALINIQTRGDAAASQLILYHYPELKEEKGIVLMTAEMDSTFLNIAEAQCIANQVQLFYATDRKETFGLVETFNFRPNEFKYMSVIAELEQSGLGAGLKCAQNEDKT
ncbi:PREDICTED: ATP synthase mitochondrial F1 complex assembly factor 1 [Dipodomys ordii]|uniref:ATP synthase mitochondrial F1 complex assembly factor 1 n=1 Tax=Dipodomys ordii TaxID=10020 RepID=A0A1S3F850_DIPOR|nr:PREDICTED: ATP synthase mitochondrial F1 complex assembly factor 1 [Dipodomys ordii]